MNESYSSFVKEPETRRRRYGKKLLVTGVILIVGSFVSFLVLAVILELTGYVFESSNIQTIIVVMMGFGIFLILLGLLGFASSKGLNEEGTWIMQMSPFAGNN